MDFNWPVPTLSEHPEHGYCLIDEIRSAFGEMQ